MKNKAMNKILSLLLTAVMALGIFAAPPMTAYAVDIGTTADISLTLVKQRTNPLPTDPGTPLVSTTLAESTTAWFGGYQWVIIGWDGDGVASKADTATLLLHKDSPNKPTNSRFDSNYTSNHYENSTLQTAMNNTITDARETNAIAPQSLTGNSGNFQYFENQDIDVSSFNSAAGSTDETQYIYGFYIYNTNTFDWYAYDSLRRGGTIGSAAYTGDYNPDNIAGSGTTEVNFWPLSVAEASLLDNTIRTYSATWWLRSPGDFASAAAIVYSTGSVFADGLTVDITYAVRPAFNLDLSSVLFTSSAASGGGASPKSDATVGSGLVGAAAPTQNLKFTVLDTSIATPTITNTTGMNFDYSGAETGADYFLSCVLVGTQGADDGVVKYYGKLADNTSASGNFALPLTGVSNGTYKLKIFCEQANGDNETDFAGKSVDMTLVVTNESGQIVQPPSITADPTGQSVTEGGTATFTVTATGDNLSYQWQVNTGGGFTDVTDGTGGTTASYTTPATTAAMNGWQYRVKVSNAAGDIESAAAALTVNAAQSSDKDITAFTISGQVGSTTIDTNTISLTMPYGEGLTSLTPSITVSANASVSPTSGTAQDFTNSVTYTVTAQDTTQKTYTVTVTNASANAHGITVTADPVGGGAPSATPANAADGATITLAANPNTDYTFTGWTVTSPAALTLSDDSDPAATFTMPDEAVTITAHYSYNPPAPPIGTATPGITSADPINLDLNGQKTATIQVSLGASNVAGDVQADSASVTTSGGVTATPTNLTSDGSVTVTAQSTGTATVTIAFSGGDVVDTQYDKTITVYVTNSYTPPTRDRDSDSGSGSSYTSPTVTVPSTLTVDAARARAALAAMKPGDTKARISHSGSIKALAGVWPVFGKTPVNFDTVANGAVQVRITVPEPEKMTKDMMMSGYVKGAEADNIKALFEKWLTNKLRVIHFEQSGVWDQPVEIAAKVDLTGMDTKNLCFYAYDKASNSYKRIEKPAYWFDKNGYLHFTTEYAGDIIISEGKLERK